MPLAVLMLGTTLAPVQPPARPAEENIYRAARVGDWVEYRTAEASPVVIRHTVTAKAADTLTLRIDQTIDGKAGPPIEQAVDLRGPWPPPEKPGKKPAMTTKVETLGSGQETLTVAGKRYECEWTRQRTTVTPEQGPPIVIVTKVWWCKDVPLGGAVRSETETGGRTSVAELTGFGRGK